MDQFPAQKHFAVTGATSGIGLAVTRLLLQQGHAVIGIGRSPERCRAQEQSLRDVCAGKARIMLLCGDLALQSEVSRLAAEIESLLKDSDAGGLDGLVNNAATVPFWQTITPEGFDLQWAVNHLAPFLLTLRLLPLLKQAAMARVVTVSSASHYGARLRWDDIQLLRRYSPLRAYAQTKLANVLFTRELDGRLRRSTNVRAFAADPGLVNTELGLKSNSVIARWAWDLRRRGGITADESARGIVYLATEPSIQDADELYWKHGKPRAADPYARNPEAAAQLWRLSSQMCGLESEGFARA